MEDTNHLILRVSNCGQILNLGGCILDSFYGQSRGHRELSGGNPIGLPLVVGNGRTIDFVNWQRNCFTACNDSLTNLG